MWYRNPGKWIRELLPNQTKDIPTTLLWSAIYILDILLIVYLLGLFGVSLLGIPYRRMTFLVIVVCIIAFFLLFAEAKLWDAIRNNKKVKE